MGNASLHNNLWPTRKKSGLVRLTACPFNLTKNNCRTLPIYTVESQTVILCIWWTDVQHSLHTLQWKISVQCRLRTPSSRNTSPILVPNPDLRKPFNNPSEYTLNRQDDSTPPCRTPLRTLKGSDKPFCHFVWTDWAEYHFASNLTKYTGPPESRSL